MYSQYHTVCLSYEWKELAAKNQVCFPRCKTALHSTCCFPLVQQSYLSMLPWKSLCSVCCLFLILRGRKEWLHVLKDKTAWNSDCRKIVLTPKTVASSSSSHRSSNCLVITIMEAWKDSPRTPIQSTAWGDCAIYGTESVSESSPSQLAKVSFQSCTSVYPEYWCGCLHLFTLAPSLLGSIYWQFRKWPLGVVCEFCSLRSSCVSHIWLLPVPL